MGNIMTLSSNYETRNIYEGLAGNYLGRANYIILDIHICILLQFAIYYVLG